MAYWVRAASWSDCICYVWHWRLKAWGGSCAVACKILFFVIAAWTIVIQDAGFLFEGPAYEKRDLLPPGFHGLGAEEDDDEGIVVSFVEGWEAGSCGLSDSGLEAIVIRLFKHNISIFPFEFPLFLFDHFFHVLLDLVCSCGFIIDLLPIIITLFIRIFKDRIFPNCRALITLRGYNLSEILIL